MKQNSYKKWYLDEYLFSDHWRKTRDAAIVRANNRCQKCGSLGPPQRDQGHYLPQVRQLQVHHLCYDRLGSELPSDLQVLCYACHKRVHQQPIPESAYLSWEEKILLSIPGELYQDDGSDGYLDDYDPLAPNETPPPPLGTGYDDDEKERHWLSLWP